MSASFLDCSITSTDGLAFLDNISMALRQHESQNTQERDQAKPKHRRQKPKRNQQGNVDVKPNRNLRSATHEPCTRHGGRKAEGKWIQTSHPPPYPVLPPPSLLILAHPPPTVPSWVHNNARTTRRQEQRSQRARTENQTYLRNLLCWNWDCKKGHCRISLNRFHASGIIVHSLAITFLF